MNYPTFSIGTIVILKASFLGEPIGTKAFVYEHYSNGGLSIITENGCDLGGFSVEEQGKYLDYYADTQKHYHFTNVITLANDFRNGVFTEFFKLAKYKSRHEQ